MIPKGQMKVQIIRYILFYVTSVKYAAIKQIQFLQSYPNHE